MAHGPSATAWKSSEFADPCGDTAWRPSRSRILAFFLRYGRVHRLGRGDVLVDSIQVRKVSGSNQIRYGPLVVTVYGLVRCLALIDDVLDSTAGYTEAG